MGTRSSVGEDGRPGTAPLGKHPHLSRAALSVWQTMRGKLDQRDLLEQELQKIWATKSLSLMLIIDGVRGFPGEAFQERCVRCLG